MRPDLQRHIRYPRDFFAIQARKYATYTCSTRRCLQPRGPWAVPRRTVEGRDREMEPYYRSCGCPGRARRSFILLTLFNRAGATT